MSHLLVATRNPGKQREIREILAEFPYKVLFPDDVGLPEDPTEIGIETESTFEGNALRKAEYFHRKARIPTIGEDSGLEVFSLGGAPGVRSKRFALATTNQDQANNDQLLRRLAGAPPDRRRAQYRCAVVLVPGGGRVPQTFEGACPGRILMEPKGTGGFGYDPLFFSEELQMSFGEAPPEKKHAVSHRGKAIRALAEWLRVHPI